MFTFTAYFDASGSSTSSAITMAGFVSRLRNWERFEEEWRALLPPEIPMFHMTDFASFKNGWEPWRGKQDRGVLFDRLVACIKKNTNQGFGISLCLSDYVKSNSTFQLEEASGGEYTLIGCACLAELRKWAVRNRIDHKQILCVFEDGDVGQGHLIDRARHDGYNAKPQSKAKIRAFDACDLAAWKARTLVDDALIRQIQDQDPVSAERVLKALDLLNPILHINAVIDQPTLESLCVTVGLPRRP